MISKKTLKNYEFSTIEDYFNYIVVSQENGNFSQVKELYNDMNKEQKNEFYNYLKLNEIAFNLTGLL